MTLIKIIFFIYSIKNIDYSCEEIALTYCNCIYSPFINRTDYNNYYFNRTIIGNITYSKQNFNNNTYYWYCKYGVCEVNFNYNNIIKLYLTVFYFIAYDFILILYKYFFIITFHKLQINSIIVKIYRFVEVICILLMILINYLDEFQCSRINGKIFNKNNKNNFFILIIDVILNKN